MKLIESETKHIQDMKRLAKNKSRWNHSEYNPSALKMAIEDDAGNFLGFIQAVPVLHINDIFIDQDLSPEEQVEIFSFAMDAFLESCVKAGRKAMWIVDKENTTHEGVYHTISKKNTGNKVFAKKMNYRKLRTWHNGVI